MVIGTRRTDLMSLRAKPGSCLEPCPRTLLRYGLAPVRILLPPSEAKLPGGEGPPVGDRPDITDPSLAAARARLLTALRRAARTAPEETRHGLRLPAGRAEVALAANRDAARAPTLPALWRYTGVLFAALDPATLPPTARARAEADVLVFSGLWGVVRGGDPVPDYRVPAAGVVPGLGAVLAHWRTPLAAALPRLVGDEPVVDLRSTDYRAMWRPGRELRDQVVAVRVLARREDGRTGPVSHHAKTTKGRLARALLTDRARVTDPLAAVDRACARLGIRWQDTSTAAARSVDVVAPIEWTRAT